MLETIISMASHYSKISLLHMSGGTDFFFLILKELYTKIIPSE